MGHYSHYVQACAEKDPVLLSISQAQPRRTFSQLSNLSIAQPCIGKNPENGKKIRRLLRIILGVKEMAVANEHDPREASLRPGARRARSQVAHAACVAVIVCPSLPRRKSEGLPGKLKKVPHFVRDKDGVEYETSSGGNKFVLPNKSTNVKSSVLGSC